MRKTHINIINVINLIVYVQSCRTKKFLCNFTILNCRSVSRSVALMKRMFLCAKETDFALFDAFSSGATHCSEMSFRVRFWSMVSNRSTQRAHIFFISNFACRVLCTVPTKNLKISAISRTLFRRSSMTMRWIFYIISNVVASIGRSGRAASFVGVRPRLSTLRGYPHLQL